jgi:hypothetical protein
MKTAAFMKKVIMIFDCRIKLWDFKQVLQKGALRSFYWERSLTCLCTEAEIELARYAYNAKVEEVK